MTLFPIFSGCPAPACAEAWVISREVSEVWTNGRESRNSLTRAWGGGGGFQKTAYLTVTGPVALSLPLLLPVNWRNRDDRWSSLIHHYHHEFRDCWRRVKQECNVFWKVMLSAGADIFCAPTVYTYMHTNINRYIYINKYIYKKKCTYIFLYIRPYLYTRTHTHIPSYINTYMNS